VAELVRRVEEEPHTMVPDSVAVWREVLGGWAIS
jgi:hypothetical protein